MTRPSGFVLAAVAAGAALVIGGLRADDGDEAQRKALKEAMAKAHRGPDSPLGRLGREVAAEEPDWAQAVKDAKSLTDVAELLRGNHSYTGSEYEVTTAALAAAARAKDKDGARRALAGVKKSCSWWHYGVPR